MEQSKGRKRRKRRGAALLGESSDQTTRVAPWSRQSTLPDASDFLQWRPLAPPVRGPGRSSDSALLLLLFLLDLHG